MTTVNPQWIVVQTHPRRERVVQDNLARQHFASYCPMLQVTTRHARRTQRALRPLFPNYVFVSLDTQIRPWRPILSTLGVRSVVLAGEKPSHLPNGFVEALRTREIDGAIARPVAPYRVGQAVWVADGPFDGMLATIVDLEASERLVVLIGLLNREVRLSIDSCRVRDLRP